MATKRYDLNRHRKIYPLIRRKPVYLDIGAGDSEVEANVIIYNNSESETYTFINTYDKLPVCIVSPEDENVNLYISAISTTSVTINASAPFTGKVHLHIYEDID